VEYRPFGTPVSAAAVPLSLALRTLTRMCLSYIHGTAHPRSARAQIARTPLHPCKNTEMLPHPRGQTGRTRRFDTAGDNSEGR
jgi:hypothetical protein